MSSIGQRVHERNWNALTKKQQAARQAAVLAMRHRPIQKRKPLPRALNVVEDRIQARMEERREAYVTQALAEQEERVAKQLVSDAILPDLQQRLLRKSPADIIRECNFLTVPIPDQPTLDQLRGLFRRSLAMQHPDRTRHLPTVVERVTAEEWFKLLNVTYQKIK